MKIVKEDLTGCINRIGTGAPKTRFWAIQEPINVTGICKAFDTEAEAKAYIESTLNNTIKNPHEKTEFTK